MGANRTAVYQLHVSDAAHDMMIDAIAELSRRKANFATLRDLVSVALDHRSTLEARQADAISTLKKSASERRVYLRIPTEMVAEIDEIKEELSTNTGLRCSVREAVLLCCLIVRDCEKDTCHHP